MLGHIVNIVFVVLLIGQGYPIIARYNARVDFFRELQSGLGAYHREHGGYPAGATGTPGQPAQAELTAKQLLDILGLRPSPVPDASILADFHYLSNRIGYSLAIFTSRINLRIAFFSNPSLVLDTEDIRLGYRSPEGPTDFLSSFDKKRTDLGLLNGAIEKYRAQYGHFPVSYAFDGPTSRYGATTPDYIPGLTPEFIPALPRAPKTDDDGFDYDYVYASDGTDYILYIKDRDFCLATLFHYRELADPSEACAYAGYRSAGAGRLTPSFLPRRLFDLNRLREALEAFRRDQGRYPHSKGFDGLHTNWGESGPNWIAGLAPRYIETLPRDPRDNDDPANQYLYASDGTDYKLIVHHPEDCETLRREHPDMVDPARGCGAYGYWTPGASTW
jgi:hypothetical protein